MEDVNKRMKLAVKKTFNPIRVSIFLFINVILYVIFGATLGSFFTFMTIMYLLKHIDHEYKFLGDDDFDTKLNK